MTEEEKLAEDILREIASLSREKQRAVGWLIKNIDIAEQLAGGEALTKAQVEELTRWAQENNDYILLILVLYKQMKDHNENPAGKDL